MQVRTTYVKAGNYIRSDISGDLDPDTARQASLKARDLAEQTGAKKFLVNMKDATDLFRTLERYKYASSMQQRSCQHNERFALVFPDGHAERQFAEDVAVNRGFNLRTFESVDGAVQWLCED